jgi:hypothetical protein
MPFAGAKRRPSMNDSGSPARCGPITPVTGAEREVRTVRILVDVAERR